MIDIVLYIVILIAFVFCMWVLHKNFKQINDNHKREMDDIAERRAELTAKRIKLEALNARAEAWRIEGSRENSRGWTTERHNAYLAKGDGLRAEYDNFKF